MARTQKPNGGPAARDVQPQAGDNVRQALLEKRLRGTACGTLHRRQFPDGSGKFDYVVIGPGGVTVIDSKNIAGTVRVRAIGIGRFRHEQLIVNGHNRPELIDGVLEQVAALEEVLSHIEPPLQLSVAGAICWTDTDGIPLFGTLSVRGVGVFHPRRLAKFVNRPGDLDLFQIQFVADYLDQVLEPA
jgi:hypothetical protein